MKKTIRVVAGIIVREDKILIARRKPGKTLAGYWEFPGGKIEGDESPEQALARELHEEFSVRVQVGKWLGTSVYSYPEQEVELLGYFAYLLEGEFALRDHDRICWEERAQLLSYLLAPADIALVHALLQES